MTRTESTLERGPAAAAAPIGAAREALCDMLAEETRILERLFELLQDQRQGVAADDVERVDESVFAIHRVLCTLREAKRRRQAAVARLAGGGESPRLEDALGGGMTDSLRAAQAGLTDAARRLSREVAINRSVLETALRAGNDYMRVLCGVPIQGVGYGADAGIGEAEGRGTLLNRQV